MQRQRGFTLIELLVVIAIIGILSVLTIVALGKSRIKARNAQARTAITEAGKAVELFRDDAEAGDKVVSTIDSATVDTLDGDETNNMNSDQTLDDLFTGVLSVTGLTYNTTLNKTPNVSYQYVYSAPPPAVDGTRDLQSIDDSGRCYILYTNILEDDQPYFMVTNGNSSNTDSPSC